MPSLPHEFDAPDLLQLLGEKGFAHWHGPLTLLMSRYAGWLSHYEFDPAFDPDLRPLSEVITATAVLVACGGADDQALASALLLRRDFVAREAVNRATRSRWEPLKQSYRDFLIQFPRAEPLWATVAPWTAAELVAWVLAQHAAPPTPAPSGQGP